MGVLLQAAGDAPVALELSPQSLVNAGGALFMLGVGLLGLVTARNRRERLEGAFALAFGAAFVVGNVVIPVDVMTFSLGAGTLGVMAAFGVALAAQQMRDLSDRRGFWIAAALTVAAVAAFQVDVLRDPARLGDAGINELTPEAARWVGLYTGAFAFVDGALALVTAALALEFARSSSAEARRSLGLRAVAFGPMVAFNGPALFVPAFPWMALASLTLALVVFGGWIHAMARGPSGIARGVLAALFVAAFSGLALIMHLLATEQAFSIDYGIPGAIRTLGALALAFVFLSRRPKPASARRISRGRLAAAALAALFVVAQVAQNFFSAEFGILMGGVVAGVFLFAASPVQRAIERLGSARGPNLPRSHDLPAQEAAFRNAVTLALRDRRLTPEEELMLADLAERLGLGPRRATEIRHAVEATLTRRP